MLQSQSSRSSRRLSSSSFTQAPAAAAAWCANASSSSAPAPADAQMTIISLARSASASRRPSRTAPILPQLRSASSQCIAREPARDPEIEQGTDESQHTTAQLLPPRVPSLAQQQNLRSRSSRRLSDALEDAQLKLAGKQVRTAITLLARDGAVNRVEHMMVHQARRSTQWDLIVTKLHENNADGTQSMTHMPSMLAKSRSTVRQQTRSRKAAAGPSSDHVDFSTQYQPMLDERELEAGRDGGGGVRVRPLTLAEAGAVKALEVLTMAVLRLKRKRQRGQAQSE